MVDPKFPKQSEFVTDDLNKLISVKCTRRAGKSYGVGLKLYRAALKHPGSTCLYLALTRASAKNIMWKDVVKKIDKGLKLDSKFNEAELTVTLKNGSEIIFAGADSSYQEMEKYLGGSYPLIVIDEAGSFKQNMNTLVYENLFPAVADFDGQIVMIGTPTRFVHTLFYEVTTGIESGWTNYEWNTFDNPYMIDNWKKQLAILKAKDPLIEEKSWYKRMYLGEWVKDDEELVYAYNQARNYVDELPHDEYFNILGIDLGWTDPTAFMIASYNDRFDQQVYMRAPFKKSHMDVTDVAKKIEWYQKKYDPIQVVIDNASKQVVEELKRRWGFNLEAAEKAQKDLHIEIMNGEWKAGRIKLVGPDMITNKPHAGKKAKDEDICYANEMKQLIWDEEFSEKAKKKEDTRQYRREHPSYPNHLCDTGLYSWRECYNFLYSPTEKKFMTEQQQVEAWEQEQADIAQMNADAYGYDEKELIEMGLEF